LLGWGDGRRSWLGIVGWRGLKLNLPLEDAGAGGSGFSLGHVTGMLQGDGESGVGQRVGGGEGGQRQGGGDGGFQAAGVAQGSNQPVMGFSVFRIDVDGGTKGRGCFSGRAGGELIETALAKYFGGESVGFGHGCIQDKG
jgi:hypothetical protein